MRDIYDRDGFLLLPRVLTPNEVADMRALLDAEFQRLGATDYLFFSETVQLSAIWKVMFHPSVVGACKAVLGDDFTVIPNINVQRNQFGDPTDSHRDCDSESRMPYLTSPDYRFFKCGVYLQDNSREWGGGILITPGKHHFPLRTGYPRVDFRLKLARDYVAIKLGERWLDIKAGDVVMFDSRLPHASAFPSRYSLEQRVNYVRLHVLPRERTKYVVYWDACSTRPYALGFMKNSARRAAAEITFCNYVRLRYPDDYPPEYLRAASNVGANIAHLSADESAHFQREWKEKYQSGAVPH